MPFQDEEIIYYPPKDITYEGYAATLKRVLNNDDYENFETATGFSISALLSELEKQSDVAKIIVKISSNKKFIPHPLNAMGLHPLRSLVSERITDHLRSENGSPQHPLFQRFMEDGILVVPDLENSGKNLPQEIYRIPGVKDMLHMVSGYKGLEGNSFSGWNNHTHFPNDVQFYLHVDTFQPTWKIFVFPETTVDKGPFHYVKGSHRNTIGKMRWLFDMSKDLVSKEALVEDKKGEHLTPYAFRTHGGSFRFLNYHPENIQSISEELESYGFNQVTPMVTKKGVTMIITDTCGLHSRGYAKPGMVRTAARFDGEGGGCGGCVPRKNVFHCEWASSSKTPC